MTAKDDFTPDEWKLLKSGPMHSAMHIIAADPSVVGMIKEVKATTTFVKESTPPAAASELVGALQVDVDAPSQSESQPETAPGEPGQQTEDALVALRRVAALVDEKCSPDEAAGFKQWLVDIATATAGASKEGGFMGVGGKRISDKEQAAIAELKELLNL